MNLEQAKQSIGKMVMSTDAGHKLICSVSTPHGPYRLLKVTKGGLAILEGREEHRIPTTLIEHWRARQANEKGQRCRRSLKRGAGISELLACRQFDEEDRDAIERVTMLLGEYAWSDDRMSENAKKLKAAMLKVWEHWQARQANEKDQR